MSDFFGLQVGMSALYASRRQMEVAAQNVANANTEGYSRQRVNQSTAGVATVAAVHARGTSGTASVKIDSITRSRDAFLEARALSEHSNLSLLQRSQSILGRIELIFDEPGETGIQAQLADFWAGWEDVANNPGSLAARSQLIERAGTLTSSINQAAVEMQELWKTSVQQLQTVVVDVNASASRVAELNGAIKRASAAGLNPNELLDQRDALALELAERIGGEVRTIELGQINIFVGGTALVRGEVAEQLKVNVPSGSNITNSDQSAYSVGLQWVKDGFGATVQGGEAGGLLDGLGRILPFYRSSLIGPRAESAVLSGDATSAATFKRDYTAGGIGARSFQLAVDGGAFTTVTLNTDLSDASAGAFGVALNKAIATAGLTGVVATVSESGGDWTVSFTSQSYGATSTVDAQANGADALFTELFGAGPLEAAEGKGVAADGPSVAYQLTQMVNLRHRQGTDLSEADAGDFFTYSVADGIALVSRDPNKISAAAQSQLKLGGDNALDVADIGSVANGPDNTFRTAIITLGVEVQTVNRRVDIQDNIAQQVDNARDGASGVSVDEEMANMVQFQHTYAAAARMMTAIDEMLNRLINGTGLVGRS